MKRRELELAGQGLGKQAGRPPSTTDRPRSKVNILFPTSWENYLASRVCSPRTSPQPRIDDRPDFFSHPPSIPIDLQERQNDLEHIVTSSSSRRVHREWRRPGEPGQRPEPMAAETSPSGSKGSQTHRRLGGPRSRHAHRKPIPFSRGGFPGPRVPARRPVVVGAQRPTIKWRLAVPRTGVARKLETRAPSSRAEQDGCPSPRTTGPDRAARVDKPIAQAQKSLFHHSCEAVQGLPAVSCSELFSSLDPPPSPTASIRNILPEKGVYTYT